LSSGRGAFAVSDEVLKPLLEKKPITPQSLVKPHEEGKLIKKWASGMIEELHEALRVLLPLKKDELDFILQICKSSEITPELITAEKPLLDIIRVHPGLLWAAKERTL